MPSGQEFLKSPSQLLLSLLQSLPSDAAHQAMLSTVEIAGKVGRRKSPSTRREHDPLDAGDCCRAGLRVPQII